MTAAEDCQRCEGLPPAVAKERRSRCLICSRTWRLPEPHGGICPKCHVQVEDYEEVADVALDISALEALSWAGAAQRETRLLATVDFMDRQPYLNTRLRAMLLDWLVQVVGEYSLRGQTFFLTQSIIDRYLSVSKPLPRKRLQLLGVAALLIASKFEEVDPPRARDMAYITGHTYTAQEVLGMEVAVLNAIGFEVDVPTPLFFLGLLQHDDKCDAEHVSFAQYVLELSVLDQRSLRYKPSMLAAASVLLSRAVLGRLPYSPDVGRCGGYAEEEDLKACTEELKSIVADLRVGPYLEVGRKYRAEAGCDLPDQLW